MQPPLNLVVLASAQIVNAALLMSVRVFCDHLLNARC